MLIQQKISEEWNRFLESQRGKLRNFFRRFVRSEDDVEDLVQITMIRAHRTLPKLKAKEAALSYLWKIATSVLFAWFRPAYRKELTGILHTKSDEDSLDPDKLELSFDYMFHNKPNSPEELVLKAASSEQILEALRQMDKRDRTLLTLYYWQDLSLGEIAELLDMKEGAVKMAISRARQRLKVLLRETAKRIVTDR